MFYPFPPTLSELAPEKPTLAVGALPLLQAFGGFWVFVKVGDGGGFVVWAWGFHISKIVSKLPLTMRTALNLKGNVAAATLNFTSASSVQNL